MEFPSADLEKTKLFFSTVFSWEFQDYGPEYICYENESLSGGFYLSDKSSVRENGAALLIFYSQSLKETQSKISDAGGTIIKPIFEFPGGSRFHFTDTTGNEFAVWSDLDP